MDEATRPIPGTFSGRNLQRLEELLCSSDDRRLGAWDTSAAPGATVGRGVTRSRQTHRGRHGLDRSWSKKVYFIKLLDLDLVSKL